MQRQPWFHIIGLMIFAWIIIDSNAGLLSAVQRQPDALGTKPLTAISAPPAEVILRVSGATLQPLAARNVRQKVTVEEMIFGTSVKGEATVKGQVGLRLIPDPHQAHVELVLSGTVHSRTVGRNGPTAVHGHTATKFLARKPVFLDEHGVRSLPAQIDCESLTTTDRLKTRVGGVRGQIIQRIAERRLEASEREVDAETKARIKLRIRQGVDRYVDSLVAALNAMLPPAQGLADRQGETQTWKLHASTTQDCLQIAFASAKCQVSSPPTMTAIMSTASIQVWLHDSLWHDRLSGIVRFWPRADRLPNSLVASTRGLLGALLPGRGPIRSLALRPATGSSWLKLDDAGAWIALGLGESASGQGLNSDGDQPILEARHTSGARR